MTNNLQATGNRTIEAGARTADPEAVIVPVRKHYENHAAVGPRLFRCRSTSTSRLGAYKTALLMFTTVMVLARSCPAQSSPFTVTMKSTPSCTFNGLSFSSQLTETISNAKSNANFASYSFEDFVVTKVPDGCSNSFYALVATGAKVPTVVISVQGGVNGSAVILEQITLSDVVITSLQNGYQNSSLVETLKLSYRAIATLWFNGNEEIKSKDSSKAKGGI